MTHPEPRADLTAAEIEQARVYLLGAIRTDYAAKATNTLCDMAQRSAAPLPEGEVVKMVERLGNALLLPVADLQIVLKDAASLLSRAYRQAGAGARVHELLAAACKTAEVEAIWDKSVCRDWYYEAKRLLDALPEPPR